MVEALRLFRKRRRPVGIASQAPHFHHFALKTPQIRTNLRASLSNGQHAQGHIHRTNTQIPVRHRYKRFATSPPVLLSFINLRSSTRATHHPTPSLHQLQQSSRTLPSSKLPSRCLRLLPRSPLPLLTASTLLLVSVLSPRSLSTRPLM